MNLRRLVLLVGAVRYSTKSSRTPTTSPQCQSAVSSRRAWAIPVAVVGLVVISGSFFSFFVGGPRRGARTP